VKHATIKVKFLTLMTDKTKVGTTIPDVRAATQKMKI
jgi:hypothetical protein